MDGDDYAILPLLAPSKKYSTRTKQKPPLNSQFYRLNFDASVLVEESTMAHGKSGLQVLKRDQRTTKTVKSQQQSNDHRPQTRHLDEMRFDSFHACQTATKIASACAIIKSNTGLLASTIDCLIITSICLL